MAAKVITGIFVDNAKAPPPDGSVDMKHNMRSSRMGAGCTSFFGLLL